MLWFNEVEDYGSIESDDGERLYVDRDGFGPQGAPVGRCAGLPVTFEQEVIAGRATAVGVVLVPEEEQRRARSRRTGIRVR